MRMADTWRMEREVLGPEKSAAAGAAVTDDLASLYDAHAGAIYRYALSLLGSSDEAEDVVQEVFLGLMRRRGHRRVERVREYLLRAARNQAFSVLRKRKVREREDESWVEIGAAGEDRELAADISAALGRLPAEQREVIALHLTEGLTFREIAEVLRVPQNTAASRYRLAVAKLKAMLMGGDEDG